MSARMQVQPIYRSITGTALIAVLAFAIGAIAAVSIDAIVDRSTSVEASTPVTLSDSGRLEAVEVRSPAGTVDAPYVHDSWMSGPGAMELRQPAETVAAPYVHDSWMSGPEFHLPGELMRSRK